jgi:hypothetical protein
MEVRAQRADVPATPAEKHHSRKATVSRGAVDKITGFDDQRAIRRQAVSGGRHCGTARVDDLECDLHRTERHAPRLNVGHHDPRVEIVAFHDQRPEGIRLHAPAHPSVVVPLRESVELAARHDVKKSTGGRPRTCRARGRS